MNEGQYLEPISNTGQSIQIAAVPGVTGPIQVPDHTAYIQNALNSGQDVFLGTGIFNTSGALTLTADTQRLVGSGWNTVIRPMSGANFDVIATAIPGSVGLSGFIQNYVGVQDLKLDCSQMSGTVAGQGNGIHFYGVRYGFIRNVFIISSPNWAIILDGDNTGPGFNFGYDNQVSSCVFDLCKAGVFCQNCEANDFFNNRFKWGGAATTALQPAFATQDTNALHLRLGSGYQYVAGNVFGRGGTYTTEAIRLSNSGPSKLIGNRFDQVRNQCIVMNGGGSIFAFNQLGGPGSAITGVPAIQLGNSNNVVVGNRVDTTAGAVGSTYIVAEAGGPFTNNTIVDNTMLTGTTGFVNLNATSTAQVARNGGYNPVGHAVAQPAVPASTTPQTNNSGVDCTVHIAGGTITVVNVGASSTGITAAAAAGSVHTVRVPSGQSIAITYSAAPTWQWFGD